MGSYLVGINAVIFFVGSGKTDTSDLSDIVELND
jgi:hypothetical protein